MVALPSYQEATARLDWLHFVAPYVRTQDCPALCLVNRRFWNVFAWRLWLNPLKTVRLSGLRPDDDLTWWLDFVFHRLSHVASTTRDLVRVLDLRDFAKDSYQPAVGQQGVNLQESFKQALILFKNLNAVLLDGHAGIDPSLLAGPQGSNHEYRPQVLSMAHCPAQLPSSFFNSPSLQSLVYLDISGVSGAISTLIQPAILLNLRILKIRGRELDDITLKSLSRVFGRRLWSLDISDNRLSDDVVQTLREWCIPVAELRSSAHFRVEGKPVILDIGTPQSGPFVSIQESEWSASFAHPERYFVDSPIYFADSSASSQDLGSRRSDGRSRIRQDSAEDACQVLCQDGHHTSESYRRPTGLTHLRLSNNQISSFGVERMLRTSNGQIESLACDSMPLLSSAGSYAKHWPKSAKLYGILGMAHIFRPVFSSNLHTLRIHHSLVTMIPTLEVNNMSALVSMYLSETSVLPRVDQAYAHGFIPDMNPRLTSLTLTCIPRSSSGPLIKRLIEFLRLLSRQERDIQETSRLSSSWRGPGLLQGLRHLRLEFGPNPMEDGFSASDNLNAEELMTSGDQGFSFFGSGQGRPLLFGGKPQSQSREAQNSSAKSRDGGEGGDGHLTESDQDIITFVNHEGEWNGGTFSVPVWIGPKASDPNSVLADYRRLVLDVGLKDDFGPATPSQIAAGAPDKSFVFHTAWCVAVMPPKLDAPTRGDLAGMNDVLDALKTYRLSGKAQYEALKTQTEGSGREVQLGEPHFFWTGRLEVSVDKPISHGRPSQFWR